MGDIVTFVQESNRIENIKQTSTLEVAATQAFLNNEEPSVKDVEELVGILQPNAILRRETHLNVHINNHIAPQGGPQIEHDLIAILDHATGNSLHPYIVHQHYETLHPFTDGNGRSGRALWAWQMLHHHYQPGIDLGFLHAFYYQSLQHADCRKEKPHG